MTGTGPSDPAYPHLGFNPVPGVPEDVTAIATALTSASASLKESGALLAQVRDAGGDVWRGQAGDAFRSHVDGDLGKRLGTAQTSLETALGIFHDWHADLVGFKSSAAELDAEAAAARQAAEQAAAKLVTAEADPAFELIGRTLTGAALRQAQQAVTDAQHALDAAGRAVTDAQGDLDAVLQRARALEAQHEAVARRFARALDHAASDLAPHKPGMFSRMWNDVGSGLDAVGSWTKDHLDAIHSVLSTVSAIAGLVALLTPPPIDVIALGVSLVAGAGALAVDAADPEFRKGISDALHGNFDAAARSSLMTGFGDAMSVVPGWGLAKEGVTAVRTGRAAVEGAEAVPTFVDLASNAAHVPGFMAKQIARHAWVGPALETTRLIEKGAGASALVTHNMVNILWHGKGVATHLFDDAKEASS